MTTQLHPAEIRRLKAMETRKKNKEARKEKAAEAFKAQIERMTYSR